MKKIVLLLVAVFNLASTGPELARPVAAASPATATSPSREFTNRHAFSRVYDELDLAKAGLHKNVFEYALHGWEKIASQKPILSIVDLSQPSNKKRLYVVDLASKKLLFNTYVSHGRNSGDLIANRFSNVNSSFQTSLGFYQTLNTYMGRHGLSLQLKGLEKGFNDNVYNRNIVIHGADYVCEDFIKRTGRLGRSQGCPAVPYADSKGIIEAVKGGTCLFVFSPDAHYLKNSPYLSSEYTSL